MHGLTSHALNTWRSLSLTLNICRLIMCGFCSPGPPVGLALTTLDGEGLGCSSPLSS